MRIVVLRYFEVNVVEVIPARSRKYRLFLVSIHLFSRISLKIAQLDALLADAGLKRGKMGSVEAISAVNRV